MVNLGMKKVEDVPCFREITKSSREVFRHTRKI